MTTTQSISDSSCCAAVGFSHDTHIGTTTSRSRQVAAGHHEGLRAKRAEQEGLVVPSLADGVGGRQAPPVNFPETGSFRSDSCAFYVSAQYRPFYFLL